MTEYQQWGVYARYVGHITHDMLNKAYGDAGMFFKTLPEARLHQIEKGGMLYPIRNYHGSSFEYGAKIRKEAKPYIEGWYVSHPPARAFNPPYVKGMK